MRLERIPIAAHELERVHRGRFEMMQAGSPNEKSPADDETTAPAPAEGPAIEARAGEVGRLRRSRRPKRLLSEPRPRPKR